MELDLGRFDRYRHGRKMKQRKWALIIGVVVFIGGVFWMRALVSWRPVTFAQVPFTPTKIVFSRDQKRLIVADNEENPRDKQIWNWKNGAVDESNKARDEFDGDLDGFSTFPRYERKTAESAIYVRLTADKTICLEGTEGGVGRFLGDKRYALGSSKALREIYGEAKGEIWIWDWKGKLKKRVRYIRKVVENAIFSPDGKWLVAYEKWPDRNGFLRRYDVRSGKMVKTVNQFTDLRSMGFSPNGFFFWWVQESSPSDLNVVRTDTWNWQWSTQCVVPVKWLSDNRIGIVKKNGFEFRDARGKVLQSLPGPVNVSDWTLSPDGDWIYSAETSGIIRKWRAR
jgi:WD40 repeat protein